MWSVGHGLRLELGDCQRFIESRSNGAEFLQPLIFCYPDPDDARPSSAECADPVQPDSQATTAFENSHRLNDMNQSFFLYFTQEAKCEMHRITLDPTHCRLRKRCLTSHPLANLPDGIQDGVVHHSFNEQPHNQAPLVWMLTRLTFLTHCYQQSRSATSMIVRS